MNKNSITQDGPVYNPATDEFEIYVEGERICYAASQGQAFDQYQEARRLLREHRNRGNGWGGRR